MLKVKSSRFRLTLALCTLVCALGSPAVTQAATQNETFEIHLPAQPLTASLAALSEQTGIQLFAAGDLITGKSAPAVSGRMTPREALHRLLAVSGLQATSSDQGFVVQHATQNPAGEPQQDPAIVLPQVTVQDTREQGYAVTQAPTATKTDTPVLDVPFSVQVVPRQVIEDQQAQRLADVVENVSNVRPGNTLGGRTDSFLVRGFPLNSFVKDGFSSNIVIQVVGNVGLTDLANVERVEILKGPASALYGLNDPGGLLNIVTKKPLSEPYYAADFTGGSHDFYRPTLDLSGPLTRDKALRYRLNVAYQTDDSFRDFFIDSDRVFVSPALSWEISPRTTLTVDAEYNDQKRQFDRGLVATGDRVADIPYSRYLGERFSRYDAKQIQGRYLLEHAFNDVWSIRNTARALTTDDHRLSADPLGLLADNRTLTRRAQNQKDETSQYALQNDVIAKFPTGFLGHKVLIGLELSRHDFKNFTQSATLASIDIFNPVYGATPGPFGPKNRNKAWLNLFGGYIQDELSLGERWRLLVGGRYDYARGRNEFRSDDFTEKVSTEDHAFSPRVGLVYQPIPTLSLYASYARSFLPQLGTTFDGSPFEPEKGEGFEVGVKSEFFSRKLTATLSFFHLTRQNVLTADPINSGFSIQTGEQRSRGVELDLAGEILPGWKVIASGAFTDAEITKDNDFPVGNRLAGVPKLSGSLWSTYEFQDGTLKGLGFGGGLFAAGRRKGDLFNSFKVPGYARTDATLYYRIKDYLQASLSFRNLFDIKYIETPVNEVFIDPGAPFTVLGKLSFKF